MSDPINDAARALSLAPWEDLTITEQVRWLNAAGRLAEAGLLVTPERDAELRAGALRMAANALYGDDRANGKHGHPLSVASWLRDLADRIEREGGSDV